MHTNMCSHYLWCEQLPILSLPSSLISHPVLIPEGDKSKCINTTAHGRADQRGRKKRVRTDGTLHSIICLFPAPSHTPWGANPWAIRCLLLHVKSHLHREYMRIWIGKVNETTHAKQINVVQCNGHRPKVGFVIIGLGLLKAIVVMVTHPGFRKRRCRWEQHRLYERLYWRGIVMR